MMVLAMVAMLVVTAVPAMAQVFFFEPFPGDENVASQEFSERRITSGAASPVFRFSNTGDNVNACPTSQQIVNTGNVANEQGVVQYASEADDIDFSGTSITIAGSVSGSCTQTIEQAAASGG